MLRTFCFLTIAFCCLSLHANRPNVILVMCDDLGYGDPQSFNADSPIQTPHIDAMVSDGLKFTRFYAAAPVCSPTRGSCLTGRHPYRYGIYTANAGHMREGEITLPEILKEQGYTTGHFGKWHLGTLTKTIKDANRGGPKGAKHFALPQTHGYDTAFVTESKVPTYDPMIKPVGAGKHAWDAIEDRSKAQAYGTRYWDEAGAEVTTNLQGDDSKLIMDRAVDFIQQASKEQQPFFAAVWFHAPHLPVVAGKEHVKPYQHFSVYERNYYGCITALDQQVGRLRDTLKRQGVDRNTMIWFCSDNGPEGQSGKAPGSASEFRGRKRSLYEGGVRVPGVLVWPGRVKPGETDFPSVTSDYLPTVLDALGIGYPDGRPLDGESLLGVIEGTKSERTRPIGFQSAKQIAWHVGKHKLYSGNAGKNWELYDLSVDPREANDIAKDHKSLVKQMVKAVRDWQASCKESDNEADYR